MKMRNGNNKKEKTIIEKKKKIKKQHKILDCGEINLDKKSKKTNLEGMRSDKKLNPEGDINIFEELQREIQNKQNEDFILEAKNQKIYFEDLKKTYSQEKLALIANNIIEISKIEDGKILVDKILQIKTQNHLVKDIIIVLNSIIISFEVEFSNLEYGKIIFAILDEKIRTFPKEIIKNIVETRCHEIISLFLDEKNGSKPTKKQNVAMGY